MDRLPYLYWYHKKKPSRLRKYTFHVYDNSSWNKQELDQYGSNFEIFIYSKSIWEAKYNCQYWLIGNLKHISVSNERHNDPFAFLRLKYYKWKRS